MATGFDALQAELADIIRTERAKRGISQEALALAADVDRTYVSQIERGIANPSLLILQQLAEALDLNVQVKLTARRP